MGWRAKISPKRAWRGAIGTSCFLILVGFYIFVLGIKHSFFPWTKSDFIEFSGTLDKSPKFTTGKYQGLELKLEEVYGFEFEINGDNYNVLKNKSEIGNLKFGDTVSLIVDKSQFNAKVNKTISSTFLQRVINWRQIRVYEFKSNGKTYLNFNDVMVELKFVSKFYLAIGLTILIGIYYYLKYEYKIYTKSKRIQPS